MNWTEIIDPWRDFTKRRRRWLMLAANFVVVAFGIVYFGRYLVEAWMQLVSVGQRISLRWLLLASLIYGLNFMLFLINWRSIATRLGVSATGRENVRIYCFTHVAQYLPTPAWMLIGRLSLYGRAGVRKRLAVTMTSTEIVLHGFVGACLLATLSVQSQNPWSYLYLLSYAPVVLIVLRPQLLEFQWFRGGIEMPGIRRSDVVSWIMLYGCTWLLAGPFLYSILRAYPASVNVGIGDLWRTWILTNLVGYLSAYTLGGIGLFREFTLSLMLSRFYVPPSALLLAFMVRIVMTLSGVAWGIGLGTLVRLLPKPGEFLMEWRRPTREGQ